MLRLLQLIFLGHWHVWENIKCVRLVDTGGNAGERVILRCKKCGTYKKKDLI